MTSFVYKNKVYLQKTSVIYLIFLSTAQGESSESGPRRSDLHVLRASVGEDTWQFVGFFGDAKAFASSGTG